MLEAASAYIEKNGKILTIEREGGNFVGFRSMPHGMVEQGETPEQAAIRETKEETGYDVKVINKITENVGRFKPTDKKYPGQDVKIFIFKCEIVGGELIQDMKPEWNTKTELISRKDIMPTIKTAFGGKD